MRNAASSLLLAGLVTAGLAGCLDDGASLELSRPEWASGFSFAYEVRGEEREQERHVGGKDSGDRSETNTVEPYQYTLHVVNTTMVNDDVPVYVAAVQKRPVGDAAAAASDMGDINLEGYRQRDLAEVALDAEATRNCREPDSAQTVPTCNIVLGPLRFGSDPKATYLDFPLRKGKSWSAEIERPFFFAVDLRWRVDAEVGSPTTVDLPMGRVKALPVDFTYTALNVDEFVREAKENEDGLESLEFQPYRHLKVYYADDYQTVVRSESLYRLDYSAVGHDDEGNRQGAEGHYEGRYVNVLVGARLVARPERDLDYIGRVLGGQIQLDDPAGESRRAVGYTLEVAASDPVVNAADHPKVSFEARIVGDPAESAGHTTTWRIRDFVGSEVAAGEGLTGSYVVDEPGHYTIEVEARDGADQVTATATAFVIANYEATIPATCPPVSVNRVLPACQAVAVPVRPGVRSLHVAAQVDSPLAAFHWGTLVLEDGEDETWDDPTNQAGRYEIDVDDFSGAAVGDSDWTLRLDELAGVLENVEYELSISYASAPAWGADAESSCHPLGLGARAGCERPDGSPF